MALGYILLGLVAMYGLYWTVKYIMLPPRVSDSSSDKPQSTLHTAKPARAIARTRLTTKAPTSKGSEFCRNAGYEHHKRSGYCYRFSRTPLPWLGAKEACEMENATLTTARIRKDQNASEEFVQNMFRKHNASVISGDNKNYMAVGLHLEVSDPEGNASDKIVVAESDFTLEDYETLKSTILNADNPKLTDVNYVITQSVENQDWVFMNRQGQLFSFLNDFKGPFICEYDASLHNNVA